MRLTFPIFLLLTASFTEGGALMAVEILSSKVIAPFYGSSLYVWAAVIATTMGGLVFGYFFGGNLSENKVVTSDKLGFLMILSALLVLIIPILSTWIMNLTINMDLRAGIALSCLVFMLPPIICFGMVSPIIIRLLTTQKEKVGFSAGLVYTISTFGGIIFTFLTGFSLISEFGIKNSAFIIAGTLFISPLFFFLFRRQFQSIIQAK